MDIFYKTIQDSLNLRIIIALSIALSIIFLASFFLLTLLLKKVSELLTMRLFSPPREKLYRQIVSPYQKWVTIVIVLIPIDLVLLIVPTPDYLKYIEFPLGVSISIIVGWLSSHWFRSFFELYLLGSALKRKINGELLVVVNIVANGVLFITIFFIFAQTHKINLLGLVTSLGIGGLAIAFAAKQTLEQLLGGIVLYIDRPFVVDDYIGLPDGTFGRVESIGLRSTKIRNSGKGTLSIVPNNSLTQLNIENFTGGRKIVSLIYLTFYREVPENERALIRQVILESTNDLFGIDSRNTVVNFKDIFQDGKANLTQAQISFFILGSGEMGMDMRQQLLDIAKQNITLQLKEYNIPFDLEEKPINVDSPITV